MSTSESFDAAAYLRAPIITVSTGISLSGALVDACPKDMPAAVQKAKKNLKAVAEKAMADFAERNRKLGVFNDEDSRVIDNHSDRRWGALGMRLEAAAMSPESNPDAARARELSQQLFHGSMKFLGEDYPTQSTTQRSILQIVDEDGLQNDIDRIAGKVYLAACREMQPRYEAMVSERARRDKASGQNLTETVRSIQSAISSYARKVVGTIDDDDADSIEAARKALLPIANHREANKRTLAATGGATGDGATDPSAETDTSTKVAK